MQTIGTSDSRSALVNPEIVDQSGHSSFFRFPLEVRLEIYSYLFTKTILHVEAVHPYAVDEEGVMVCPQLEEIEDDLLEGRDYKMKPNGDVVLLKHHPGPTKPIGRFVKLEHDATYSRLFVFYRCTSSKSFESASACPPGYSDHGDCGKIRARPTRAFRHTCRQAYNETASLAHDAKSDTAFQFSNLRDLQAFSMLLTYDQREDIRHIRVNIVGVQYALPAWHYFCNVFATPWDRRSIKGLFENDYPNDAAEITFYYNYASHDLSDNDRVRALASSWVMPNVHLEWKFRSSSWGTVMDLWDLRARSPLSVRFAMPQFLARTENGEVDRYEETMWDDVAQAPLMPGDDGYVRSAERNLTETDEIQELLAEKRRILGSVTAEEKERFQQSYDTKFHHYWYDPHLNQPNWGPGWLRPLQQCQHFESIDIDFYDEEGPRTSMGLDILRDGLKARFSSLDIGPHPFLLYTH